MDFVSWAMGSHRGLGAQSSEWSLARMRSSQKPLNKVDIRGDGDWMSSAQQYNKTWMSKFRVYKPSSWLAT